ncbi:hypothetical protein [Polynucleobacter sp. MWH-UH2A]|uniref:hypothetical protein n=1 Tax=Polynucleobacter sp. MWH-UH2A TaxID=1855617 RepID=UPI001BFEC38D|nr:hypothetical protein [Polynucleobacter sp. MWH-UH2A]QWD64661.1 hypothetical protein IC571_03250 [Polynucleobacter sp. MWH-UH2A]
MSKKSYGIFRGMRYSDFLFLWVLFANLLLVAYLGVADHQKALKIGYSQTSGEQIIAWFEGFNQKLQENKPVEQQSCVPAQEGAASPEGAKPNTWNDCIGSLFAADGPFHEYTNLLNPEDPAFASKCDKHELGTSGAFIFEKLTMNPAGPPVVGPMELHEKLVSGQNVRLSLCDTGYYLVKIGEFKL